MPRSDQFKVAFIGLLSGALAAIITGFFTLKIANAQLEPGMRGEIDALREEVMQLRLYQTERVNQSVAFVEHLPFPAWLKLVEDGGETFRMAWINRAYEEVYHIDRLQYEGRTDSEIWGKEIAQLYNENDVRVFVTRRAIVTQENINTDPINGGEIEVHIVSKFPVVLSGERKLAIGGISIPLNTLAEHKLAP